MADARDKPSTLATLRQRYEWLDHLLRAGASYTENHGDHYAAAVTYFSVLALFPLFMVAFAVGAIVLARDEVLLGQIKEKITTAAPGGLGSTLSGVVDSAVHSAGTVGVFGLLIALYSGLGWMSNLREALSAQWGQRTESPPLVRRMLVDLIALIGLGLALALSMAVTAASQLAQDILRFVGLAHLSGLAPLFSGLGLVFALLANALVFLWVIARLPRRPVTWRSAAKAAVIGALGYQVIQRVMIIYLAVVTHSPTGALFGPVLGLMIFIFTVSRFLLFLTAWAATAKENQVAAPPSVPGPAVIRSEVTVCDGPGVSTAVGLVGAGVLAGLATARLTRRR